MTPFPETVSDPELPGTKCEGCLSDATYMDKNLHLDFAEDAGRGYDMFASTSL